MFDLEALGLSPHFQAYLTPDEIHSARVARIAAEHRGSYEVWSRAGVTRATASARLRRAASKLGPASSPAVGDWVILVAAPVSDAPAVIDRIIDRKTALARAAAGRAARPQIVAANVDRVFIVCGLDADYSLRRLERYLTVVAASGADPVIVLSKADMCDSVELRRREVEARCPGVPLVATSAPAAIGMSDVAAMAPPGVTVALVGSSGAGKSTLINTLVGEDLLPSGAVRAHDGRGRHTTTHRQLVRLPGGGLLIDTPGMREIALSDDSGIGDAFGEIAAIASGCRFRDCRHAGEPGCAVVAAVEAGDLDPDRLDHHRRLEREAAAFEIRSDARRRRQAAREWGRLSDEVAQLRRWKGGKD